MTWPLAARKMWILFGSNEIVGRSPGFMRRGAGLGQHHAQGFPAGFHRDDRDIAQGFEQMHLGGDHGLALARQADVVRADADKRLLARIGAA